MELYNENGFDLLNPTHDMKQLEDEAVGVAPREETVDGVITPPDDGLNVESGSAAVNDTAVASSSPVETSSVEQQLDWASIIDDAVESAKNNVPVVRKSNKVTQEELLESHPIVISPVS